jgi:hypothetical protein
MKNLLTILFLFFFSSLTFAQDFSGSWKGDLEVMGQKLPLVFHISQKENEYTTTLDSPMQGAVGIPMDKTEVANQEISIRNSTMNAVFKGKITDGKLSGKFTQNGFDLPLVLSRADKDAAVFNRPQEPKPPFDYATEELKIKNESQGNILAGTLVIPKNFIKTSPVVVFITGSGAQNRDEELFGHKPFLVIADYLAKKGIASLRMDDRGVGGSDKGKVGATSADFATDISSAVNDLVAHGFKNIGLIGHSEGGMIAPMVANQNKNVKFMVLLAAPGIPISDLMVIQNDNMGKLAGLPEKTLDQNRKINQETYDFVKKYKGNNLEKEMLPFMENQLKTVAAGKMTSEEIFEKSKKDLEIFENPWFQYFLKFNPDNYLSKIKIPVLALNGSLDMQVSAKENLEGIRQSLTKAGNKNFKIVEFPNLNHLFQTTKTGNPMEYGQIEETIAPEVLQKISDWVLGIK